jgi:hypothetical protein
MSRVDVECRRLLPWGPVLLLLLSCSTLAGGGGTNALSQDDGENSLPPLGNPPRLSPGSWTCSGECRFRSGNMDHAETATAEYMVSADGRQILWIRVFCTDDFEYKADFFSDPLSVDQLTDQDGLLTYEDTENEVALLWADPNLMMFKVLAGGWAFDRSYYQTEFMGHVYCRKKT